MKELRKFFEHVQAHETVEGLRGPLLISLTVSIIMIMLVAPVPTTISCLILLLLSFVVNGLGLALPLPISYGLGLVMLYSLRATLPHGVYSPEFIASFFAILSLCQSLRLKRYWHCELLLIWLLASNGTAALLDRSATLSVWIFLVMFFNLGQMLRLHVRNFSLATLTNSLRSALRTTAYTLPMLFVFVYVFQRSYEHTRMLSESSVSGISRNLEPGQVSKLTTRSGVAYRVATSRPLPPLVDLYWRVATLTQSKGLSWKSASHETGFMAMQRGSFVSANDCTISQKIFGQEYDTRDSVLAIDRPLEGTLIRHTPSEITSNICGGVREKELNTDEMKNDLKVDTKISPEVKTLVASLNLKGKSPTDTAYSILRYFKNHGFKYTLQPHIMFDKHALDTFLFSTHEGFCEHYAAALATLLRVAGVPSRVVVGFHGGTYNSLGGYWLISYQDAHAWVELWSGTHWERVDPLTVIAPNELKGSRQSASFLTKLGRLPGFESVWLALDAIFFKVQQFFSGRDRLVALADLTLDPFLALGSLLALFIFLQIKKFWRPIELVVQDHFRNFCSYLAGRGVRRGRSEGYESYRKRVIEWMAGESHLKDLVQPVDELFLIYLDFRFGARSSSREHMKNILAMTKSVSKRLRAQLRFQIPYMKRKTG